MMRTMLLFLAQFLLCGTAFAQPISLLFESEPGRRPVQGWANGELQNSESALDANGDGRTDIILIEPDESGNLEGATVLDGRTREVIWEIDNLPEVLGLANGTEVAMEDIYIIFADPDGDGIREATVYHEATDLFVINPRTNILQFSWGVSQAGGYSMRFVGAADITGDGFEELIVYIPDTKVLQIWGKPD